jgi:hypothetical protein
MPVEIDGNEWETLRDSGLAPTKVSELDATEWKRQEFVTGCEAFGLIGKRKHVQPQQLLVADVLNMDRPFNSIMEPRRAAKTTSLFAWAFGRCASRDEYLIAYTMMTTGKKARDRFLKDVAPVLERVFPNADTRGFKIRRAAGQERIEFDNGSVLQWLAPQGDDFRSDAYDVIILDESGEPEPEKVEDVLSGALSTMDTRPDAMIVVAGTAGKFRAGNLLWAELERGRSKDPRAGHLEWSIPDDTAAEELEAWEPSPEHPEAHVRELVEQTHPGLYGPYPLVAGGVDVIKERFDRMKPDQFAREYLGLFGIEGVSKTIFAPDKWAKSADAGELPTPPERFSLALTVHRHQTTASVTAAWRDEKGKAHALVLAHDRGVSWVVERVHELALKYSVPIVHDSMGVVLVETEALARKKPPIRFEPQTTRNVITAAALLVKEFENDRFVHHNQSALNDAAEVTVKRRILSGWGFGTLTDDDDNTALEGAAMALRVYDETAPRKRYTANF